MINAYTGAVAGEYPKSWVKILFAVLLALGCAGVIALLAHR